MVSFIEHPFYTHLSIWVLSVKSYIAKKFPDEREFVGLKAAKREKVELKSAVLVVGLFTRINLPDRKNVGGGDGS